MRFSFMSGKNCCLSLLIILIALSSGCGDAGGNVSQRSKKYSQRIAYVLDQDRQCGSKNPGEQYRKMCNISLEGCPIEFCEAYNEHKAAWKEAADLIEEAENYTKKSNSDEAVVLGFIEGFLGGLCGDPTYGYNQAVERNNKAISYFEQRSIEIQTSIKDTYQKCLRVADSYGIEVGKYY